LEVEYIESFPAVFPEDTFAELLSVTECHYCGISIAEIEKLGSAKKLLKKSL